MDFYDDDVEFNSPCLLIESSQADEATVFSKMDKQHLYLGHLTTQLNHHASPRSLSRGKQDIKIVTALSETGAGKNQSTTNTSGSTGNATMNTQHQGQAQASSSSRGGGGGEGGDGGDDRHFHNSPPEPDVCDDSTDHSEESGTSVPELIPVTSKQPSRLMPHADGSFSSDSNPSMKIGSGSSSSSMTEGTHHSASEASTAIADEVYQSRLETSDEMVPPLNKKSSSSSLGKSKSDTSSSLYPASSATSSLTSSLSSDTSLQYHPSLDPVKEDAEQKEEEICSQDLFAEKEDSNAISSQEVSRISTPQDRSTPVENKQGKSHTQDLYRQVLRSTSTPLNSQEPITPPSNGEFNCLQFSGSSTSQSGGKSEILHDSSIGAPLPEPSSPTAQYVTCTTVASTESSSSSSGFVISSAHSMQIDSTPEQLGNSHSNKHVEHISRCVSETTDSDAIINPSPDSFQYRAGKVSTSPDENSDVGLPHWHKKIISKEKVSTTCSSDESPPSSSNNGANESEHQKESWCKEWQSVQSSSKSESVTTREQPIAVKHVTFLMDDSESQPEPCQSEHATADNEDDSLSPSSLVIDDQQGLAKLTPPPNKSHSCSQPDLSDDLFNAVTESTQEEDASIKDDQDISGILYPDDGEEEMAEYQFDLHLTQSQTDSQMQHEDAFIEHVQIVTSTEHDIDLLTTHPKDSSSTLQVPLSSRDVRYDGEDTQVTKQANEDVTDVMYKSMTQHTARESTPNTEPAVMSNEEYLDKTNQLPQLTNTAADQQPKNTLEQYLLSSNTSKQTTTLDRNNVQEYLMSTDGIPKQTNPVDAIQQPVTTQQPSRTTQQPTPLNTKNPSSPTIPNQLPVQTIANQQQTSCAVPLLSSELSTESITSFHFSLPPTAGEVLVASTCTTPPPMPSWQPPEREASIETLSDSLPSHQPPQPSLTFSMPRQDTPDSEHVGIVLPFDQPSTSNVFDVPATSQSTESSVLARARSRKNNQPKRKDKGKGPSTRPLDNHQEQTFLDKRPADPDDYNPFLFSSQDSVACEPLIKRPRTNQTSEVNATNIPYSNLQQDIKLEPNSYINTTTVRTITTVRTEVKRVITLEITKEGSDEVIERVMYEEEDEPFVEQKTNDDVTQELIVETGNITYVRQPPPPPLPTLDELPRVSPRRRSQDDNDKPPRKNRKRKTKNDDDPLKKKRRRRDAEQQSKKKFSKKTRHNNNDEDDNDEGSGDETDNGPIVTPPSPLRLDCTVRLSKGTRVYARWADGFFYPGAVFAIANFQPDMFYEVLFDDGDRRKTRSFQLMACDILPIGQPVMAQDPDGYYDPGIIVGQSEESYEVRIEKTHERKKYPKKHIILSEDQIRILARTNISSSTSSTEPVISSNALTKSRDTSAKDTNSPNQQTTTQTAENNDETPKSTRKTRRRRGGARHSSKKKSSSDDSAEARPPRKAPKRAKRNLLKKPSLPSRSSPRKQVQQNNNTASSQKNNNTTSSQQNNITASSNDQITTNNLPTNDSIFAGFAFLITRCCNLSSDSENELQEFDRAQVVRQIEAGGGVILKDFNEVQNTVADQCFLISNTYCRTVKYFQCLANGIPVVSHMWIHDCTVLNRLQDHNNYLLPAGLSLETTEVVECKTRAKLLTGLNVYLQGDNQFKVTWSSVLTAAGAQVVSKLPNRPNRAAQLDDNELCNVVIAQSPSLPQSLDYTCQSLGIPIVSLEWLFQCLINGYIVDYKGHPKYDYKHVPDNSEDI